MINQRKKLGWSLLVPVFALVLSLFGGLFSPNYASAFTAADCDAQFSNNALQSACKEGFNNGGTKDYCNKFTGGAKDACNTGWNGANGGTPTNNNPVPTGLDTFCKAQYSNQQLIAACIAGGSNASNTGYCNSNYTGGAKDACVIGQNHVNGVTNPNPNVTGIAAFCQSKFTNQQLIDACTKGGDQNNYGNDNYCNNFTGGAKDACITGRNEARRLNPSYVNTTPSGSNTNSGNNTCIVPYVGWAVCPILLAVSKGVDAAYNVVEGILETPVSIFTESSTNGVGEVYGKVLNVANIVLAIIFLIIIVAQAVPGIMPNYTMKKYLPKLMIAAVALNLAFWICAAVVDVVNIVGSSIPSFFSGLTAQNVNQNVPTDWTIPVIGSSGSGQFGSATGSANNFGDFTGSILAGTAVIGGVAIFSAGGLAPVGWAILMFLIPIVLGAIVAILAILLALVLRSALIIVLIIISPLAFAALALPNTEKLFSKWWDLFFKLLLLYPIVALVFGASKLAGSVLMNVATTSSGSIVGAFLAMAASAATILPLILVPGIMKGAVSATGKLGQKIESMGDKGYSGAKSLTDKRMKESGVGQYYAKKAETDKALKTGGYNLGERRATLAAMPNRRDWRRAYGTTISNKVGEDYAKGYELLLGNQTAGMSFMDQQQFYADEFVKASAAGDFAKANVLMTQKLGRTQPGRALLKKAMIQHQIGYGSTAFDNLIKGAIGSNKDSFINDAQMWQFGIGYSNKIDSPVDVVKVGLSDSEIVKQTPGSMANLTNLDAARARSILMNRSLDLNADMRAQLTYMRDHGTWNPSIK